MLEMKLRWAAYCIIINEAYQCSNKQKDGDTLQNSNVMVAPCIFHTKTFLDGRNQFKHQTFLCAFLKPAKPGLPYNVIFCFLAVALECCHCRAFPSEIPRSNSLDPKGEYSHKAECKS